MERLRDGSEPRLAANLIVTQFVLPPRRLGLRLQRSTALATRCSGVSDDSSGSAGASRRSICGNRQSALAIVRPAAAESMARNHWVALSSSIWKKSRTGAAARISA